MIKRETWINVSNINYIPAQLYPTSAILDGVFYLLEVRADEAYTLSNLIQIAAF
jgi:hypothetical protein